MAGVPGKVWGGVLPPECLRGELTGSASEVAYALALAQYTPRIGSPALAITRFGPPSLPRPGFYLGKGVVSTRMRECCKSVSVDQAAYLY